MKDALDHAALKTKQRAIRAAFPEDEPLYAEAGFRAKNHIQLCILNETNCIKGYFRPLSAA